MLERARGKAQSTRLRLIGHELTTTRLLELPDWALPKLVGDGLGRRPRRSRRRHTPVARRSVGGHWNRHSALFRGQPASPRGHAGGRVRLRALAVDWRLRVDWRLSKAPPWCLGTDQSTGCVCHASTAIHLRCTSGPLSVAGACAWAGPRAPLSPSLSARYEYLCQHFSHRPPRCGAARLDADRSDSDKHDAFTPDHEVLQGLDNQLELEVVYASRPDYARAWPALDAGEPWGLWCTDHRCRLCVRRGL
jgi:hypothetical protein